MISPSIELLNAIEQTKSQVWLEQLRVLHGNQLTTFVGSWIAVVLLAYLYSEAIPRNYLVGWLVLASIVAVGRTTWWLAQKIGRAHV